MSKEQRNRGEIVVNLAKIEQAKLVVTQSNQLILSAYEMTALEKRLLMLIIGLIRQNEDDFVTYTIPAKQVYKHLGIRNNQYNSLKRVLRNLLSRVITLETDRGYKHFQWLSVAEYIKRGADGNNEAQLAIRIHDHMAPFLLQLKKEFQQIPIQEIIELGSFSTIRLVEILLVATLNLQKKQAYFELEELKELLGLKGKYNEYRNFRRRILETAKKECEEKTSLGFSYTKRTEGNTVIGLEFTVWKNATQKQTEVNFEDTKEVSERESIAMLLREINYSGKASKLLDQYGLKKVKKVLKYVRAQAGLTNPAGLLVKMLKDDSLPENQELDEKIATKKIDSKQKQSFKKLADELSLAFSNARIAFVQQQWEGFADEIQDKVLAKLPKKTVADYNRKGADKAFFMFSLAELQRLEEFKFPEQLDNVEQFVQDHENYQYLNPQDLLHIFQIMEA